MRENRKKLEGREESEEEKYQFMREQIRPQRKRKLIQYLKKICIVMLLAFVFGVVSGVAFVTMQNILWSAENESIHDAMTNAEVDDKDAGEGTVAVSDKEFKDAIATLKDYQVFCEKAALVGERCNQYVVEIKAEDEASIFDANSTENYVKSGVLFKQTLRYCYILTDLEGISENEKLKIIVYDSYEVNAEVFGVDSSLGIAVLRVKREEIPKEIYNEIKCAEIKSVLNLKLNTPVIAVGNPSGAFGSVELGNVIKKEINGSIVDGDVNLFCTNIKGDKNGNGFVLDIKGRVIGIITTSFTGVTGEENCAFMGSDKVLPAINRLISGKEMPYLGIKGLDVKEGIAKSLEIQEGVYISDVISGSPAYKSKIRVADVLVKIDDIEIGSIEKMRNYLETCSSGDEITVCVKRSSGEEYQERKMKVVLR